ncbi:restriction endonuclease [Halobaculum sp. MBLA0147]|uniref:restriction endonuclease n=1 Tax=Halobaculum sp. MBLA0147 TaxID=3079934 RepID=UPI0035242ADD
MSTQTTPEIDADDETLSIDGFELEDASVASHFAEFDDGDRAEELERVLRLGVETAGLAATTGEEEYVERKFEQMRSDFEAEIERVEEEVEEKFGTDGEVPAVFEKHLGEDGTLRSRLDDAFGEDGVFVDRLDDELGEDGERIQAALDPDTDGTPIQRLRSQLREDISQLRDKIEEVTTEEETREEIRGRTRLKGDDFEDTVEELLSDLVYGTSHSLEYTGETTGEIANEKVGDFVLTLDETDQRIVVEAKSDKGYTQPDIQEELGRAIENRDADYGIIVFECEEYVPNKVGYFHEFETDRLVVTLSEDEEEDEVEPGFLRIAFNWAKTRAVQNYASADSGTDLEVIQANIGQVEDKIGQFSTIRSKTTSIKKTANEIDEELEEIETEIGERLTAIRTELAGNS